MPQVLAPPEAHRLLLVPVTPLRNLLIRRRPFLPILLLLVIRLHPRLPTEEPPLLLANPRRPPPPPPQPPPAAAAVGRAAGAGGAEGAAPPTPSAPCGGGIGGRHHLPSSVRGRLLGRVEQAGGGGGGAGEDGGVRGGRGEELVGRGGAAGAGHARGRDGRFLLLLHPDQQPLPRRWWWWGCCWHGACLVRRQAIKQQPTSECNRSRARLAGCCVLCAVCLSSGGGWIGWMDGVSVAVCVRVFDTWEPPRAGRCSATTQPTPAHRGKPKAIYIYIYKQSHQPIQSQCDRRMHPRHHDASIAG